MTPAHIWEINPTGREAARRARSAVRRGGRVDLRTHCPKDGHCRARVQLLVDGRVVAGANYQQTRAHSTWCASCPGNLGPAGAASRGRDLRVVVRLRRTGGRAAARALVRQ